MSAPLRFDGRVALVTGAGGGLGKQYALLFAERGASVVVNDLGGSFKGEGQDSRPADLVVEEIRAKGGKAVANYDSVENGDKLVQTALDSFGRIDIVVNNAGILRDRSFARISDNDWDIIQQVHLRGSFMVTRAAWPHMKKQNFGRVIMTTSSAGIYGNFGQANYSAAKLGLVGLSNTLAVEGAKYSITCNTIAPTAGSRLTATVMPEEMLNSLKPEYVSPLVVYLCHDEVKENGGLFEIGGGWMSKVRWERSQGSNVRKKGVSMTPEQVRDNWQKITDFTDADHPESIKDNTAAVVKALEVIDGEDENQSPPAGEPGKINPELAKSAKVAPAMFTFTSRDVILYNLGIGVSTSQPDHLKFLFEYADGFGPVPTFGFIPAQMSMMGLFTGNIPGLAVDPTKILHGEQYLEVFNAIPTSGKLKSVGSIADVLDKGKGCVVVYDVDTFDEAGNKVFYNQFTIFVVGAGNFGGKRNSDKAVAAISAPKRKPDASVVEKTGGDQAALYRLSGDLNPLHIDPNFAAMGGFSEPILHGLCSLGYAARHVMKQYADNDMSKFKAIKTRMSKPVLPGQTLTTDMWKEGSRVFFETKVVENGNVSLSGGYVDLVGVATDSLPAAKQVSAPTLASEAVFKEMEQKLSPDIIKKVNAVYLWVVTKNGKEAARWTVDLKTGGGTIYKGDPKQGKAGCQLTLSDEDLVAMVTGKLNPQQAFMKGKLKVKGNIMLSQKLSVLFQQQAKL